VSLRYRLIAIATLACITVSSGAALAAKSVGTAIPIVGQTAQKLQFGQLPLSGTVACQLGELGAPARAFNYLLPPNDAYYTLLNPADCPGCASPSIQITLGHWYLYYQQPGTCVSSISVSVVGAKGDVACFSPDPTVVLCPKLSYNVQVNGPGLYDIQLPLGAACCIDKPAFLEFTFNASTCQPLPAIVTTNGCTNCTSYNLFPGGNDDLCPILDGNLIMFADAACCGTTPTLNGSWGQVKSLYR
jgi:hypothetical protein